MMHYLHQHVSIGQFYNIDKSSYSVMTGTHDTASAVYTGTRPQSLKCSDPYPAGTNGNCSIYLHTVGNDAGKLADLVYIVKDNQMGPDAIDVYSAPMLDCTTCASSTAYILFIGDSACNKDAALLWLIQTIALPFMTEMRAHAGKNAADAVSLNIDGDPRQLQVMSCDTIRTALVNANVILGKSPASCTPLFQPLDSGKLFLASKTRFRGLLNDGYTPADPTVVKGLKDIFHDHRRKFPKKYKQNKKPSEALGTYFTTAIKLLYTAAEALRGTAVSSVLQDSFRISGVSPLNPALIRDRCKYAWSEEEASGFLMAVPTLSEVFASNFELKESDFDDCGIPTNNKSRDELPVHRRRALLLHAPHVLADLRDQAERTQK